MSKSVIRWWMLGSVLLALVLAPFLAKGDAAMLKLEKDNRTEIAAMTSTTRERLDRNYEVYQSMSPEEQDRIANFHSQLHQYPEHKSTLDSYISWLGTLEPYQRDRLNQVETAAERIELISKIVQEQQRRSIDRVLPSRNSGERTILESEDLHKVMAEMERLSSLSLKQKEELSSLQGLQRYYQLLTFLGTDQLSGKAEPLSVNPPSVFSTLVDKFDQFVEDSDLREALRKSDEESPAKKFAHVLARSMFFELFTSRMKVSDEELRSFFDSLSEAEQDQLLNLEASDFQSDLKNLYSREGIVATDGLRKLFYSNEQMYEFMGRRGDKFRPPGGAGPPGFRGGPGRGRGDGPPPDFDRDRRPTDRLQRPGGDGRSRPKPPEDLRAFEDRPEKTDSE